MEENCLLEVTGSVEQIIFKNESNGYTVLSLATEDDIITAVGIMPLAGVGEELRLVGRFKEHPSFGQQFSVEAYERFMPTTSKAIIKYLSSGSVKGIGPVLAARIVETFGDNTIEIMQKDSQRLCSIKGITKAKAQSISEELNNIFGMKEVMMYLSNYGITAEESIKIWKTFGSGAIDQINENPYIICDSPIEISFDKADQISMSLEKSQDNGFRIRAGIIYVLEHNMKNGHTCLPKDKLIPAAAGFLEVDISKVEDEIEALINSNLLVLESFNNRDFIFIPKMYNSEIYTAGRIIMLLNFPPRIITGIEEKIEKIELENGIKYASLQKEAITAALLKGTLILTGGPGTGKTTTLNAIIKILNSVGEKVLLAAPTGRAAKRMSELTGYEAKTIHRLLEVEWDEKDNAKFKRNEKNLLECDALVLDELSMVDSNIFESVLKALPLGARLIMVGDSDQLPSVGPGNVLGDLVNSGAVPVVKLEQIFRQAMSSLIITNAHKIVKGINPELSKKDNDFFFLDSWDAEKIGNIIGDLCTKRLPKAYGYSPLFDMQVICPGKKGKVGTIELNKKLQSALNPYNPEKKEILINGNVFRENDKVMQIKNNYNIPWKRDSGESGEGVFNGDVGILIGIDRSTSSLLVAFDDKVAVYNFENASELELAYAITIHKSQGSEFEVVIMPMFRGAPQLSYRNLLYTGVTRAKSMIIMVGVKDEVYKMVENNRKTKRFSGLYNFLILSRDN